MWEAGDLACPPSLMTGSFCNGRSISFDRGPDARRRPTALALFAKVGSLSRPSSDSRAMQTNFDKRAVSPHAISK